MSIVEGDVERWRRPGAGEMFLAFLLLAAIGCLCSWLSHIASPRDLLWPFLVTAFLTWRVSRGGRISRMILLLASAASCAAAVLAVAQLWNLAITALVITCAGQVALLVSPPVYGRTRHPPILVRAPGRDSWFAGRRRGCCHGGSSRERC